MYVDGDDMKRELRESVVMGHDKCSESDTDLSLFNI